MNPALTNSALNSGASASEACLNALLSSPDVPEEVKRCIPRYRITIKFLSDHQWWEAVAEEVKAFLDLEEEQSGEKSAGVQSFLSAKKTSKHDAKGSAESGV